MQALWSEAWELADGGDREGAEELFLEANELGASFPTNDARRCRLTGDVALGNARIPFTDWDADVAISHGREEQRPTALYRWVGWVDGADRDRHPVRPSMPLANDGGRRLVLPAVRIDGGAALGAEGVFRSLGAESVGDRIEFDVARDGTWTVRLKRDTGPRALAD